MSVTSSEVLDVKRWLSQQHIATSSDWINACLQFVKQEHAGQNLSAHSLRNFVYEQWLVADLEEIKESSLPPGLPTAQKTLLTGSYALQVDGIRDVGRPAYSQLKEMQGNVNENAEVSATPQAAAPEWEAKPTRMLMLNLTDGCVCVQGMEYKTISLLSPSLPPGVKVLIIGPIECRFGLLLLTSEKIKILGGEVETKLQKFSREALLREILQLPSVDDDNSHANSASIINNENDRQSITRDSHPAVNSNVSQGQSVPSFGNASASMTDDLNPFESASSMMDDLDHFESDDDDFVQSLDYNALDQLENIREPEPEPAQDIWQEDEDVIQELLAFQDQNVQFEFPFEAAESNSAINKEAPFIYLSEALKNTPVSAVITIKGFIITVLSKLECTVEEGWNLSVKVNDGTATLDVNVHDKVLEEFIGISAADMVDMQVQASGNTQVREKILEAISSCKLKLQKLNCLMDLKFTPYDKRPSIIKCYPLNKHHLQQLYERNKMS